MRIYHEVVEGWNRPNAKISRERLGEWIDHVKIGYSHQPHELRVVPSLWIRQLGDVVFERKHDSGGHFFAWEKPELLIADLREMFKKRIGESYLSKPYGLYLITHAKLLHSCANDAFYSCNS